MVAKVRPTNNIKELHANHRETHGVTGIPGINILHILDILMRAVLKKKNVRKTKVTVTGIQSVEDLSYANITAVPPLPKMTLNASTSALAAASNPAEFIYLVKNGIPYNLRTENDTHLIQIAMFVSLTYTIIADFDFEKLSNTNCTYEDEAFESLVTAKDRCRSNKQCAGVFQRNCSDDNYYYICLKNKTISSDFQIEGCLHYKFPIGK